MINPQSEDAKKHTALLREKFKMDPAKMKDVDARYGPLEWRLPETHAIYWASLGLDKTKGQKELIVLRRVIYQSMQLAFQRGRLITVKSENSILFGPNLEIIPRTSAAYEEAIEQDVENRDHIRRAHRNFLMDAVYFLYVNNRVADANRWFKYIREKYPEAHVDNRPLSKMSLEDYALARYGVDITETDNNRVKAMIQGLYVNVFQNLLIDEDDVARAHEQMAKRIYDHYQAQVDAQKNSAQAQRVGLPPLKEIRQVVLDDLLDPENGLKPSLRAQLRTKL
ncbi:MAG TPA: hypothetical protein VFA77_09495, partial [Candidatus Eisenbacteria bacterium]|nr:hypothetical protein [Candidatus Eisenbacteria bacterium]